MLQNEDVEARHVAVSNYVSGLQRDPDSACVAVAWLNPHVVVLVNEHLDVRAVWIRLVSLVVDLFTLNGEVLLWVLSEPVRDLNLRSRVLSDHHVGKLSQEVILGAGLVRCGQSFGPWVSVFVEDDLGT